MATLQQAEAEPRTGQVRFDGFISYSHTADELLAPRLQAALQTFAKPWWKRRALRIFRDQSSLSANPHLWSSITAALDASDWFILLTSPEAAGSVWVDREVAYWKAHKDPERILPVLTDGILAWDEASGRLDRNSSVPPALFDAFAGEPRWVDLRWAEEETQLDLRNGRFREVVADIASSLRGIPKDDLESEEVRQHRAVGGERYGGQVVHCGRIGEGRDLSACGDIGHHDPGLYLGYRGEPGPVRRQIEGHETPRRRDVRPGTQPARMGCLAQGVDRFDRLLGLRWGRLDCLQAEENAQFGVVVQHVDCRGCQFPGTGQRLG
jgi:hypothetical protein